MKTYITSGELPADTVSARAVYCGLDCTITRAVWDVLELKFEEKHQFAYRLMCRCQAPALAMMLRGIRVDLNARNKLIEILEEEERFLTALLNFLARELWGKPLNANSPTQLKEFFFDGEGFKLAPLYVSIKGESKVSTGAENLRKLQKTWALPGVFAGLILALKDTAKLGGTLRSAISDDGRCRTTFGVAGTKTGRWSASKDAFWRGMNLQNPTDRVRKIFVADLGCELAYVDLDGAESWAVAAYGAAALGRTGPYWAACAAGDVHTGVARRIWRDLPWTGNPQEDRKIAETKAFGRMSYRDIAKRGGHATNYRGAPIKMSQVLGVSLAQAKEFQEKYLEEFFDVKAFQDQITLDLQAGGMTNLFGRFRQCQGNYDDPKTLREVTAHQPQSFIADLLNQCMCRLFESSWRFPTEWGFSLLSQLHDAVLVQYKPRFRDVVLQQIAVAFDFPVPIRALTGGALVATLRVPHSAQFGTNWGKFHETKNRGGLK